MPFGLGPTELIIILGIALLLFGAKKLPEIGSSLGKAIKEFRKTQSDDSNSENKSISSSLASIYSAAFIDAEITTALSASSGNTAIAVSL